MRKLYPFISTISYLVVMGFLIWFFFDLWIPQGSFLNWVDGQSMYPTLIDNQIVFTDTSREFERGDIVTAWISAKKDGKQEKKLIIKRVIGLPGEEVVINKAGIYINGEILVEDYLTEEAVESTFVKNRNNRITLDEDEYFLLGDNRKVSYDSRSFGAVSYENITYKQMEKPTTNFWIKLLLLVVMMVVAIVVYFLWCGLSERLEWKIFSREKRK